MNIVKTAKFTWFYWKIFLFRSVFDEPFWDILRCPMGSAPLAPTRRPQITLSPGPTKFPHTYPPTPMTTEYNRYLDRHNKRKWGLPYGHDTPYMPLTLFDSNSAQRSKYYSLGPFWTSKSFCPQTPMGIRVYPLMHDEHPHFTSSQPVDLLLLAGHWFFVNCLKF